MITIKSITKSFGSLQVLKGIDLQINKGEVVSIVGPSGAGKTTLLQIIGTLDLMAVKWWLMVWMLVRYRARN